jgi:dTDP-4-dehydrorhamnose reductase
LANSDAVKRYLDDHRPDLIVNPAAWTRVDQAEAEPDAAHKLNAALPEQLARYCAQQGAWFIHYSTDYVYSGKGTEPFTETSAPAPLSVYGKTKLAGDEAVQALCPNHLILRTSWVYSHTGHNFLKTMLRLGKERDEISVVNDQIGTPTSAQFLSNITLSLIEKIRKDQLAPPGIYHAVPSGYISWFDFAEAIFEQANLVWAECQKGADLSQKWDNPNGRVDKTIIKLQINGIPTSAYPTRAARPLNSRLSNQKLAQALRCELPTWDAALRDTVKRAMLEA